MNNALSTYSSFFIIFANISFNFCLPFEANIVNSCVKQATNSNRLNLGMSLSYEQDLPPPAYRAKLENSSLEMSR
jgi:hypothetical protein